MAERARPPIVWRYVTLLGADDLKSILRLAMSQEAVTFITRFPGRKKLFVKLACLMAIFFTRYLGAWIAQKVRLGFKEISVQEKRNEGNDRRERGVEPKEKTEIPAESSFPQR